ncbi:metallophosphoesterase [Candidatus Woesearchaeota archaeon]|nr:metallophosphoesterase [Candidatus Woesearchaeota archaeon]
MKIGVISDSHDQRERILQAIEIFNKEEVELVAHCGDWVSPFSAARFSTLKCRIMGVFGNNDGDRKLHREKNGGFIEYHDNEMELAADGRRIFVTHGHLQQQLKIALKSGKYDAVFSGHTHVAHIKSVGKTLWLNPGTLVDETSDDVKGMSIAVYDTERNTARIIQTT